MIHDLHCLNVFSQSINHHISSMRSTIVSPHIRKYHVISISNKQQKNQTNINELVEYWIEYFCSQFYSKNFRYRYLRVHCPCQAAEYYSTRISAMVEYFSNVINIIIMMSEQHIILYTLIWVIFINLIIIIPNMETNFYL